MLHRDAVALEDGERPPHEADLARHVSLLHVHGDEVALAGDAGDEVLVLADARLLADDRALVLGTVGVLDLDGDVDLAHREDGLLLEDGGAHVGELAHLVEGDAADRARVVDDARVGGEEAGDVRPVLIEAGVDAPGEDGARDVAAAALEELDLAVDGRAVEAGEHEGALAHHHVLEARRGALHVDLAVVVEDHDVGGVHEGHAEILGHEVGGEPLAARDDVLGRVLLDVLGEELELLVDGPLEPELLGDVEEALLDVGEKRRAVDVILYMRVHEQQKVGDLVVGREALARRGHHDEAAVGVGLDDGLDLAELLRRGDRGAAELCDLDHARNPS